MSIVDTLDPDCPNTYDTCVVAWRENCGNKDPGLSTTHEGQVIIEAMNAACERIWGCLAKNGLTPEQMPLWRGLATWHYRATILEFGPQRIARKDPELLRAMDRWDEYLKSLCAGDIAILAADKTIIEPGGLSALEHLQPESMVDDGPLGWPDNGMVFASDVNDQFTQCAEEPEN